MGPGRCSPLTQEDWHCKTCATGGKLTENGRKNPQLRLPLPSCQVRSLSQPMPLGTPRWPSDRHADNVPTREKYSIVLRKEGEGGRREGGGRRGGVRASVSCPTAIKPSASWSMLGGGSLILGRRARCVFATPRSHHLRFLVPSGWDQVA